MLRSIGLLERSIAFCRSAPTRLAQLRFLGFVVGVLPDHVPLQGCFQEKFQVIKVVELVIKFYIIY